MKDGYIKTGPRTWEQAGRQTDLDAHRGKRGEWLNCHPTNRGQCRWCWDANEQAKYLGSGQGVKQGCLSRAACLLVVVGSGIAAGIVQLIGIIS